MFILSKRKLPTWRYLQVNIDESQSLMKNSNIHQYSLDFDIDGMLLEKSQKVQGAISMEIYRVDLSSGSVAAIVCTTNLVYITVPTTGGAHEIAKIDNITAMNYDKEMSLLLVAFLNKR